MSSMENNLKIESEKSAVEDALIEAGLLNVEAPRPNTEAYHRLMATAIGYMTEVIKMDTPVAPLSPDTYNERDDYYKPSSKKAPNFTSSGTVRREFHETLASMLLGKPFNRLSKIEKDQLSNFAAYVTGNEGYVGKW